LFRSVFAFLQPSSPGGLLFFYLYLCQKLPSHHFLTTITPVKVSIAVMLTQTEFAGFYELIVHFMELLFLLLDVIHGVV